MSASPREDSSAGSDEGEPFEDAADGGVEETRPEKVENKGGNETTKEYDEMESVPQESSTRRPKGKGIAALMARFQGAQKAEDDASSSRTSTEEMDGTSEAEEGTESSASHEHDASEDSREYALKKMERKTLTEEVVTGSGENRTSTSGDDSEVEMLTSEGAASLLNPNEVISNPFAAAPDANETIRGEEEEEGEGEDEQISEPATPQPDLKRFSSTSGNRISSSRSSVAQTPSTAYANRFSTVSLSTTHANSSKRNTVSGQASDLATPSTSTGEAEYSGSSDFLARNTARLSLVDKGQRKSMADSEKIKEKIQELRSITHSRDNSSVRGGPRSSVAEDMKSDRTSIDKTALEDERNSDTMLHEQRISWDGPPGDEFGEEGIDWDFWGEVMSDYQEIARTQPQKLSRAIQAGIPDALRGMMWQLMSSSKDEEMEIIYAYYLKQNSPHEKMIRKDLSRTFPEQGYFQDGKGIGQENLFNVVKAYSLYDEECGYCQGMQFVVGPMLLNMPDEEAFSTLVRLMKSYDLRGHFVPNMPTLQLRLYQFDRLLEEFLPLLFRHLVRSGVKTSMYASGWFMTCEFY